MVLFHVNGDPRWYRLGPNKHGPSAQDRSRSYRRIGSEKIALCDVDARSVRIGSLPFIAPRLREIAKTPFDLSRQLEMGGRIEPMSHRQFFFRVLFMTNRKTRTPPSRLSVDQLGYGIRVIETDEDLEMRRAIGASPTNTIKKELRSLAHVVGSARRDRGYLGFPLYSSMIYF